ncbi:unnamed protein product, partial [Closterium sp. NIES-54]
ARYSTPATVSLGRRFLPFLFPDLASFERSADLIAHLRSLDVSYRAASTEAQLALLPPPMAITVYFIATSLPDRLASVRDALLLKHPSELTIEVLESALKDIESNLRSVAAASGTVSPPLFHGCTVPQLPTFTASLATATTDATAAAVTTTSRSCGRGGKKGGSGGGGGGGSGGSGGAVATGGGGSAASGETPRAAAGDSTAPAGGGDPRARQSPPVLPAPLGGAAAWYQAQRQQHLQQQQQPLSSQQPQQQQRQQLAPGSGLRQPQRGAAYPPCPYQCFAQLTDTVRLTYGVGGPAPDWVPLVQRYGSALWGMSAEQLVDLISAPHAMYAVVDSSVSDSVYSGVVSLGASLAQLPVASVASPLSLGPERERYFLVVVDDFSRYTTVFPLAKKSEVTSTLIRWLLTTEDTRGRRVSCLHSDRGGEFRSGILTGFCREQGIRHSWTLPESPQQNGVAERRIGLPYAVRYAAHQLNLWPRVSRPEVSPTSLWTGSPGVASRFRVWGCLALVRDTSADKLSPRAVPCVFLGFPEDSSDFTFYHPPSHRFFDSRDVGFEESTPYYVRYPSRGLPVPPPPLFLTAVPPPAPPVQPPPPGPAPSGVSQATPPPSVAPPVQPPSPQSSSQRAAGASSREVAAAPVPVPVSGSGGAGVGAGGGAGVGAGVGADSVGAEDSCRPGAGAGRADTGGAPSGGEGAPPSGFGEPGSGAGVSASSGGGVPGSSGVDSGAAAASDTTPPPHPYPTRHQARVRRARDEQLELEREERELQRLAEQQQQQLDPQEQQSQQQPRPQQQQSQQQPLPPPVSGLRALGLPSPSPPSSASPLVYGPTFPPPDSSPAVFPSSPPLSSSPPSRSWATRRSPRARPSSPVPFTDLRTAFLRSSPPRPSQSVLPSPPESALTVSLPTPVTDYYRMYRPVLSRVLASLVTHPR